MASDAVVAIDAVVPGGIGDEVDVTDSPAIVRARYCGTAPADIGVRGCKRGRAPIESELLSAGLDPGDDAAERSEIAEGMRRGTPGSGFSPAFRGILCAGRGVACPSTFDSAPGTDSRLDELDAVLIVLARGEL